MSRKEEDFVDKCQQTRTIDAPALASSSRESNLEFGDAYVEQGAGDGRSLLPHDGADASGNPSQIDEDNGRKIEDSVAGSRDNFDEEHGELVAQYSVPPASAGLVAAANETSTTSMTFAQSPWDEGESPPVPISHIAAAYEAMDDMTKSINTVNSGEPMAPLGPLTATYNDIENQKNAKMKSVVGATDAAEHLNLGDESLAAIHQENNGTQPTSAEKVVHTTDASQGTMPQLASEVLDPPIGPNIEPETINQEYSNGSLFGAQQHSTISPSVSVSFTDPASSPAAQIEHVVREPSIRADPETGSILVGEVSPAITEGTPAFHEVQATLVETELYHATRISDSSNGSSTTTNDTGYADAAPRNGQKQKYIIPALLVIIGVLAGIVGTSLTTSEDGNGNGSAPVNRVVPTISPISNSSPSSDPSSRQSYSPSTAPSATPTEIPITLPSSTPNQSPTRSNCLRVTTGDAPATSGPVDIFLDSGSGLNLLSNSGRVYAPKEVVVDQCFDTIIGIQVSNQSPDGWAGSFELSTDGRATYYPLMCPDCTGITNSMPISVDGDYNSFGGCLNGKNCTITKMPTTLPLGDSSYSPPRSNCLLVTTGDAPATGGPVDIFLDSGSGLNLLSNSGRVYAPSLNGKNCTITKMPTTLLSTTPPRSNCLLVTTGNDEYNGGPLDVFLDSGSGPALLSNSSITYAPGVVVVDQCFDTIIGIQVRNQNTNGWAGSFELSTDGRKSYFKLVCPDCTGTTSSMPNADRCGW
eukprot:CAMPEP_0183747148 /NCGR_PEP_ID=MMETSP0737-20130205/67116_1 /TAXON_ID=385413 /ORGANISM="Thalassiosira miniscula, Strain CCMP1093" /LENGTH=753 /DNA_ID=CAMNT_0025982857 /DNA_START=9 /DNA_END=2270 /DNA_ORIENTATION=+